MDKATDSVGHARG